jgi:nicotinamidase/pyrazinamidase
MMVAEDYCVQKTCMDAAEKGFGVYIVEDCTRGVDETTIAQARKDLKAAGVKYIHSTQIEKIFS